jgi:hypothetical protein
MLCRGSMQHVILILSWHCSNDFLHTQLVRAVHSCGSSRFLPAAFIICEEWYQIPGRAAHIGVLGSCTQCPVRIYLLNRV